MVKVVAIEKSIQKGVLYRYIASEYIEETMKKRRVLVACSSHKVKERVTAEIHSLLTSRGILVEGETALMTTEKVFFGAQIAEAARTLSVDLVLDASTVDEDDNPEIEDQRTEMRIYLSFGVAKHVKGK
jgi:hypothetical protein